MYEEEAKLIAPVKIIPSITKLNTIVCVEPNSNKKTRF